MRLYCRRGVNSVTMNKPLVQGTTRVYNGSSGSPTFSFSSDTNTGMYRVDSDALGFSVGGNIGMQITSDQKLEYINLMILRLFTDGADDSIATFIITDGRNLEHITIYN